MRDESSASIIVISPRECERLVQASVSSLVMDTNMPVMNGIEAARRINQESLHMGIVGLSIHDADEMLQRMSAAGISACVTKEADVKTLCHAIEEAAARRV